MLNVNLIVIFVCAQVFIINSYTIHHIQRPFLFEFDNESNDELYSKLLQTELLLNEANPSAIISSSTSLFDQTDGQSHNLQKRGRQCLWKVCSWALDKRALRSSVSSPSNPIDLLSKLFY
ncbi:unnamed protein product [Rotaria magnacalcarata]|uniref:Uncharacterized protein n=1 Tax=Rotaria magnacalcarata TaxID=392030 RepID=A0A816RIT6_9BILA|nr:unnamed protein product [Rotaria magnacalcarata]CAF1225751.1 unnamed protein product [Rotaria magnacalcarata]CAF1930918.1 unnamed protein product [Rotaria magnacalcarata]CAF2051900.1 unnamed protein product [Rotaria magnacalcarata]CAF2073882.1 unnamed protein product [Rotaria magnacalcarata]